MSAPSARLQVPRFQTAFGALVLAQAAHSVEEYAGRLWEAFPPARFVSGLISQNLETGFLVINIALVAFGVWCFLGPVRRSWPSAIPLAWVWVTIEVINGVGHPLWSIQRGGYAPGVATAPFLLILALHLARITFHMSPPGPRGSITSKAGTTRSDD